MSETKVLLTNYLCVLFSGKAGVGKTTCANMSIKFIKEIYGLNTPEVFSFARGVKEIAEQAFGWDGIKDEKGRKLLQSVGKAGRDYNPDIWVERTLNRFYAGALFNDYLVVDDWRFPNEYNYIVDNEPSLYAVSIRIESPEREILKGTDQYNDISEVSLPTVELEENVENAYFKKNVNNYDYVLFNIGTLSDLESMLHIILSEEIEKIRFRTKKH